MRELFDQGMTLDAGARIVTLEDQIGTARDRITELEARQHPSDSPGVTEPPADANES